MKSFFILFLVVFFGSITNGKMPNKEYREFDLYTESSFYKDGKKFQVTELSLKQSNELRDILSKYNLFVEGKTESTFPFTCEKNFLESFCVILMNCPSM